MEYNHNLTELEYFNSIPAYGKPVQETNNQGLTGFYHIKFNCNIELARAVYAGFCVARPNLKQNLRFHVNLSGTSVIFGGRFLSNSYAHGSLYSLMSRYVGTLGKKKKKEVAI